MSGIGIKILVKEEVVMDRKYYISDFNPTYQKRLEEIKKQNIGGLDLRPVLLDSDNYIKELAFKAIKEDVTKTLESIKDYDGKIIFYIANKDLNFKIEFPLSVFKYGDIHSDRYGIWFGLELNSEGFLNETIRFFVSTVIKLHLNYNYMLYEKQRYLEEEARAAEWQYKVDTWRDDDED